MSAISMAQLQKSLDHTKMGEMSEGEIYLGGLLSQLLQKFPIISVSFLNTQFCGKGKEFSLNFDFLRKTSVFSISVIGSDLKIFLRDQQKYDPRFDSFNKEDKFFFELGNILEKDANSCRSLMKKLVENKEVGTLSQLQEQWSSNRFKFTVPFLLRNSYQFGLYMDDSGKSFVKRHPPNKTGQIDFDESTIWRMVEEKGVQELVAHCLKNLLSKVDVPINQGTLQSCINFGAVSVDKQFLKNNDDIFVGGGAQGIALKNSKAATLIGTIEPPVKKSKAKAQPGQRAPMSDQIISEIRKAHLNRQTVVLLGEQNSFPPIFLAESGLSETGQIESMLALKNYIESKISNKN